jgi:hypothetical protein
MTFRRGGPGQDTLTEDSTWLMSAWAGNVSGIETHRNPSRLRPRSITKIATVSAVNFQFFSRAWVKSSRNSSSQPGRPPAVRRPE